MNKLTKDQWLHIIHRTGKAAAAIEKVCKELESPKIHHMLLVLNYPPRIKLVMSVAGTNDLDALQTKISDALTPVCEEHGVAIHRFYDLPTTMRDVSWNRSTEYELRVPYQEDLP